MNPDGRRVYKDPNGYLYYVDRDPEGMEPEFQIASGEEEEEETEFKEGK